MRILILTNFDVGLYQFRRELIQELLTKNEVYISLPYGELVAPLVEMGCFFFDTPMERRGMNPVRDAKLFATYRRIFREVKPEKVICYTIKPNIYGGFAARLEYDRLYLTDRSPAASFSPVTLSPGETVLIPELGLRVECRIEENFQEKAKTLSTFAVKYDTIEQTPRITIRPRQAHDVMRTAGGTKTLKKLLIDRKVPAARRALMPVAADASGVLGVYGIGVDLGRAATPGDRAVIITIEETEKED